MRQRMNGFTKKDTPTFPNKLFKQTNKQTIEKKHCVQESIWQQHTNRLIELLGDQFEFVDQAQCQTIHSSSNDAIVILQT
jgi:hypothetical protein